MKTKIKLSPPPSPDVDEVPEVPLKAYFCGCALSGFFVNGQAIYDMFSMSNEGDLDRIAAYAHDLGERLYKLYVEENPQVIRKFNQKVGL